MKVLAIAVRPVKEGPMREVDRVELSPESGVAGDHGHSARRGVTFLSAKQWETVTRELGVNLPWHTRRANVLLEADTLAPLIGRTIRIGRVCVEILGETDPCAKMDRQYAGLREALVRECRGGVYGRVLVGGEIGVGDVAEEVWT